MEIAPNNIGRLLSDVRNAFAAQASKFDPGTNSLRAWTHARLDTSSGRDKVVDALKIIQRNKLKGLAWDLKTGLLAGSVG